MFRALGFPLSKISNVSPLVLRSALIKYDIGVGLRTISTIQHQTPPDSSSLRRVFDNNAYWAKFNGSESRPSNHSLRAGAETRSTKQTGLFQNPYLTSPGGLRRFSRQTLAKAYSLADYMRTDSSDEALQKYILNLDQLSDLLCRVIDLCEFIRCSHPDKEFVEAAQDCHEEMFEFMNMLNTDVQLCEKLKDILANKKIVSKLTDEEVKVGKMLFEDFEKSGVYMEPEVREKFIELSQEISVVGQEFITNTDYVEKNYITIDRDKLQDSLLSKEVVPHLVKDITGKRYKIPTYGYIPHMILRACKDEEIREKVWTAMHTCSSKQVQRLTKLIQLRSMLANMLGKSSFAKYQLEGKMVKSPENVQNFISTLLNFTKPKVAAELLPMAEKKSCQSLNALAVDNILAIVLPWDRDFYGYEKETNSVPSSLGDPKISHYFTLGNVMQGLSDLFSEIYGIKLEPVRVKNGETWSQEVRRLNVVSENDGVIGVIYCDLLERSGKMSNPAHFTICCSREIRPDEVDISAIQTSHDRHGRKFQLSVISLVCNFSSQVESSGEVQCFLQLNEIETLFHEMGHAIHSMLGRTRLQNTSGTRCVTDFVELPSILMEHFARDTRVLQRIARHYKTGKPIPESLLLSHLQKMEHLKYCESYSQAKMALLDQELHGEKVSKNIRSLDVVKTYQDLEKRLQVLADDKSNWCAKFGHLYGYGAMYYSYLFDRAIAAKVWDRLFKADPYGRQGGEIFKNSVLKWGGSRDPWSCLAETFDRPELAEGGTEAMEFFGNADEI